MPQITTIEVTQDSFFIYSSHFDRKWVDATKTLPVRTWNRPRWIVPRHAATLEQLQTLYSPFGRVMVSKSIVPAITAGMITQKYPFLYPFQVKAAAQAASSGRLLFAHDLGTGKTLSTFAAALEIINNDSTVKSILVICPASIQLQWQREITRWYRKPSVIVKGDRARRQKVWDLAAPGVVKIISYESFRQSGFVLDDTTVVIADELSKIKNKSKIHKVFADLGKTIKYRIGATGTPASGRLEHYKNIMDFIQPSWMTYDFFDKNYTIKNMVTIRGGAQRLVTVGYRNTEDFVRRLDGFVDRVTKADAAPNLPPLTFEWRTVEMTSAQHRLVDELMEYAKKKGNGILPVWQLLHTCADGTQVTHESQSEILLELPMSEIPVEESPKLKEIADILDEIGDEKVIIFSQFSRFARRIQVYLNKRASKDIASLVTGESSVEKRNDIITEFRTSPAIQYLVATDCLAMGISLSEINYELQTDLPADISVFLQRAGRVHRLDSRDPKVVISLVSEGLEQDIQEILEEKASLNEQLLEKTFDPSTIRRKIEEKYGFRSADQ